MKKALLLFLCFIGLTTTSCSLDDDGANFYFVPLQIVDAELPESFMLNQTYQIKVTYVAPNDCTTFEGFDITKSDSEDMIVRNVVAIGSEIEQQQCTQVVQEIETTFSFLCLYSKTYVFRFWTGEDANGESEYLEFEVPVNQ
ncbi:MAG TPA: hypothetical protein VKN36_06425 [Eudoraea sp.]|nr:hypothetical protein [Eudoraea sp.]